MGERSLNPPLSEVSGPHCEKLNLFRQPEPFNSQDIQKSEVANPQKHFKHWFLGTVLFSLLTMQPFK